MMARQPASSRSIGAEHTMLRRVPAFELLATHYTDAVLDPEHDVRREQGYRSRLELLSLQARNVPADDRI
jgi:hypothetical protein